ncbi:MAG: ABC transporter ATP-binding protein [Atopobiaceae bacterium]|nr:ABC transporter ATP-binding protein [Atopobiaceae bacterium]
MELKLDRLTKQFGAKIAVDRVSATLEPGVTGLLGANGAGKTTLMRMVCDVLRPTGGQILLDGHDAQELGDEYRALLGYLPQDFGYYPDFSALDFMCYMATLKGFGSRDGRARSMQLLEEVGLADDARRKIKTFSGGMRQRLGIAQAMINDPAILVLDEPTAGLDPKERVRFRNLIASFAQDKIVILSTHIVSDVEFIANRILVMRQGSFVLDGTPKQVVAQAAGKVWECHVDATRAEAMAASMQVANVRYATDGHAVVRVVTDDRPMEDAIAVEPTLEDLYLLVFRDDGRR